MNILMHLCCAPCGIFPIETLKNEGMNLSGYYYNPNIHPIEEFIKRKSMVEVISKKYEINVEYSDENLENEWLQFNDKKIRCSMCYEKRIEKTARLALDNGFDGFTTSLLVSPYQNHDLIVEYSNKYSEKYGIQFIYRDFRVGFREGQQIARKLELYMQKYCGCIFSIEEAKNQKKKTKNKPNLI